MTKTRDELIARTLSRLGITGLGRAAYANETVTVNTGIEPCIATLKGLEVIYIADPDNIDDEVFEQLAVMLADSVKGYFGVGQILDADGSSPVSRARAELRSLGYGRPSGAILQGEYM